MTQTPLCAVITPTWHRHQYLLDRAIPSVQAQQYTNHQHIIVSDGPDPGLAEKLTSSLLLDRHDDGTLRSPMSWYVHDQLPEHADGKHWGNPARKHALRMVSPEAEFIAYLDDDDAYRPDHLALHVQALLHTPHAGFSISQMMVHNNWGAAPEIIGTSNHEMKAGHVGTPMIVHRRELLQVAGWGDDHIQEDWNLVGAWLNAGIGYIRIDEVTVDVWPARYRIGEE